MNLNVMVKSEPRSVAKGQFQCRISAGAITLIQRKKQIEIPVGVNANYLGKNRIGVTLPEGRLELFVTKFGCYQDRLAKDMAAFLAGGQGAPEPGDYSLPWYLYAVSALPLGIPVLTLGGAIPAVIGFGLAGACFGICRKEEWPVPVRLLAAAALVAVGYVALFALLAAAIAGRRP